MRVGRQELDAALKIVVYQWLRYIKQLIRNQRAALIIFSGQWLRNSDLGGGGWPLCTWGQVRLPSVILKKSKKYGQNFIPKTGVGGLIYG